MTEHERTIHTAEQLVQSVLGKQFNQKIPPETLREVAEKIAQTIPRQRPKKAA